MVHPRNPRAIKYIIPYAHRTNLYGTLNVYLHHPPPESDSRRPPGTPRCCRPNIRKPLRIVGECVGLIQLPRFASGEGYRRNFLSLLVTLSRFLRLPFSHSNPRDGALSCQSVPHLLYALDDAFTWRLSSEIGSLGRFCSPSTTRFAISQL